MRSIVYPSVYKKHHDLFSIEREANIISCNKIRTFLDMSEITTRYIINVFNSKYNRLIKNKNQIKAKKQFKISTNRKNIDK